MWGTIFTGIQDSLWHLVSLFQNVAETLRAWAHRSLTGASLLGVSPGFITLESGIKREIGNEGNGFFACKLNAAFSKALQQSTVVWWKANAHHAFIQKTVKEHAQGYCIASVCKVVSFTFGSLLAALLNLLIATSCSFVTQGLLFNLRFLHF